MKLIVLKKVFLLNLGKPLQLSKNTQLQLALISEL